MKKASKIAIITLSSLVGALVLSVAGYVSYIFISYDRIGDTALEVRQHSNNNELKVNEDYSCLTYNIGFGAYSQDYTFFLDTGYDENGNETCGYYSKAKSKDEVIKNTNNAISCVYDSKIDFALFQEVDTDSTRSHHVNQDEMIQNKFANYDSVYACNFHTAYMPYPLYDMHGKSNAGLTTISKYAINEAQRKEYTISDSFSKFFDLDRCFSYSVIKVENGKDFYLVNSHMSAYDEGGVIRGQQLQELNGFLQERKNNGDYVLVGGDFNHDLLTNNPDFDYNGQDKRAFNEAKRNPDWLSFFFNEQKQSPLIDGYKVVASDNSPTCRNNDISWIEGQTYVCCVDGFIVSDNIEVVNHYNIKTKNGNKGVDGFANSDHEPAYISFKLK